MTRAHPPGDARAAPSTVVSGARVIDLADPDWCWAQLRTATRGLLSSPHLERRASVDVACTLADRHLLLTLQRDRELLHVLAERQVTLGLAGRRADGLRWVVRVTGVAVPALLRPEVDVLEDCRDSHPARGAGPPASNALLLPVDRLRGFFETPLDGGPAAP